MTVKTCTQQHYGLFVTGRAYRNDLLLHRGAEPDNRNDMFVELQTQLMQVGYEIHTKDVLGSIGAEPEFEVHLNVHNEPFVRPAFLIQLENPYIRPLNARQDLINRYLHVFHWDTSVDPSNRTLIGGFPVTLSADTASQDFYQRERLSCMIASNKNSVAPREKNLYAERIRTIRWFEQNEPASFDLFGSGWHQPAKQTGWRRLLQKTTSKLGIPSPSLFPSWKGAIDSKQSIMQLYRFSFCYENVEGLSGYITEKIFDSMSAGCIPIYWGAPDVAEHIPSDCFVDRRNFKSHEDLYAYLHSMTPQEFQFKQAAMSRFMYEAQYSRFDAREFGKTVAQKIAECLKEVHL